MIRLAKVALGESGMNALRDDRGTGEPAKQEIKARDRLIVPLDARPKEARKIVDDLGELVSFYKIPGWLHILPGTDDLLQDLTDANKEVFWDIKGADIPETMKGYALSAASQGFRFMTIHGNGEVPDAAIRAALEAKGSKLKILMVTVLTSLGDGDVRQIYKKYESVEQLVKARLRRALDLGVDGVIASGKEAAMIRKIATRRKRNKFYIVTPGIRPAGASHDDHKRAVTPTEAVMNGANFLVVGRPIIQANDRKQAAKQIIDEMQAAFDRRQQRLS
jgi:orotidine-5'-phosphate decarboxylase